MEESACKESLHLVLDTLMPWHQENNDLSTVEVNMLGLDNLLCYMYDVTQA